MIQRSGPTYYPKSLDLDFEIKYLARCSGEKCFSKCENQSSLLFLAYEAADSKNKADEVTKIAKILKICIRSEYRAPTFVVEPLIFGENHSSEETRFRVKKVSGKYLDKQHQIGSSAEKHSDD